MKLYLRAGSLIVVLVAYSIPIYAMNHNNNNNRSINDEANESTALIDHPSFDQDYDEIIHSCARLVCCPYFVVQSCKHEEEQRDVNHQLELARKKVQLHAIIADMNQAANVQPAANQEALIGTNITISPGSEPNRRSTHNVNVSYCCCCGQPADHEDEENAKALREIHRKKEFNDQMKQLGYVEDRQEFLWYMKNGSKPWSIIRQAYVLKETNNNNDNSRKN